MKILFEKKSWFEAKTKLRGLYVFLTERDFHYNPGEECKVPEKIREILRMSVEEFYKLTGLHIEKRHEEERMDVNLSIIWTEADNGRRYKG